jgi:predicted PurR-regulated permease PerM
LQRTGNASRRGFAMATSVDTEESDAADMGGQSRASRYNNRELRRILEPLNIRSLVSSGILLLLTLYALKLASAFFIPVVLAVLLNYLFASVIRGLARLRIPAPLGAGLILFVLLGTLGFGIYQLASPARDWLAKLPETVEQVERKLRGIKQSVREVSKATQEVDRLTDLSGKKTQEVEVKKVTLGESLLGPTQEFVVGAGLVFVLLFFLLASGDLFLRKLVSVLPSFHNKKLAVEISRQIEHDISSYLLTITIINVCFGAAVGSCMYLLGLPNPVLWGVMAGFLHFVPFLGAIVGISVVTMVALVTLEGVTTIALVPVSYLSLNLLEEYLVLPLVMGHRFMLNPVVVLLWLLFWGWLWGIPGALMAVPLLAILKIVCDHVQALSAVAEFLGP